MVNISVDQRQLAEFCRQRHIRRMAFFGSVLRADFGPQSDIDVLVGFEPAHVVKREHSTFPQAPSSTSIPPPGSGKSISWSMR